MIAPALAEDVTYADVLAHPDDTAINIAYSQQLVRDGKLNSAAASLERLLLTHPDADDVRLQYMIVLYRVADMPGARREIEILRRHKLSDNQTNDLNRYASAVEEGSKTTRYKAYLVSGARWDSNRTFAPEAGFTNTGKPDAALVSSIGLSFEHDFGASRTKLFGSVDVSMMRQFDLSQFDTEGGKAELGLEFGFEGMKARFAGVARGYRLSGQFFDRELGGNGKLIVNATDQLKLFTDIEVVDQVFEQITFNGAPLNGQLHSGLKERGGVGLIFEANERNQITIAARAGNKDAVEDRYGYQSGDVEATWLMTFTGGQYASLGGSFGHYEFKAADVDYGNVVRKDDVLKGRALYGLPIGTIGQWAGINMGSFLGPLNIQGAVEYAQQGSSIPNLEYKNVGFEALFIRRVAF